LRKLAIAFSLFAVSAFAADITGFLSDAKCAADVKKVESEAHAGCAAACVKKGEPVVLVSEGKVYQIANQDKVTAHAGHKVTISGKLDGETLTVDTVKM
jgi:hypothetical protein